MFGQKVLFCLETGVWGAGVPRPGPGMPGCLRAPSSPASRSPAAGEPRPGSTAASDSAFWTPSSAPTSRGAGMGEVPRHPGLARRCQARSPSRPLLGASCRRRRGRRTVDREGDRQAGARPHLACAAARPLARRGLGA